MFDSQLCALKALAWNKRTVPLECVLCTLYANSCLSWSSVATCFPAPTGPRWRTVNPSCLGSIPSPELGCPTSIRSCPPKRYRNKGKKILTWPLIFLSLWFWKLMSFFCSWFLLFCSWYVVFLAADVFFCSNCIFFQRKSFFSSWCRFFAADVVFCS